MKVYAHFKFDKTTSDSKKKEYRWRTLLQFGDQDNSKAWNIIGSVYLKNPGSAYPVSAQSINDKTLLEYLKFFDDKYDWYEFKSDDTMKCIEKLFQDYNEKNSKPIPLQGVIQIFNLYNFRSADIDILHNAISSGFLNPNSDSLLCTTTEDIEALKKYEAPIYIGWRNEWELCNVNAQRVFNFVKRTNYGKYLETNITDNKFYHPRYLYRYAKEQTIKEKESFFQNTTKPSL